MVDRWRCGHRRCNSGPGSHGYADRSALFRQPPRRSTRRCGARAVLELGAGRDAVAAAIASLAEGVRGPRHLGGTSVQQRCSGTSRATWSGSARRRRRAGPPGLLGRFWAPTRTRRHAPRSNPGRSPGSDPKRRCRVKLPRNSSHVSGGIPLLAPVDRDLPSARRAPFRCRLANGGDRACESAQEHATLTDGIDRGIHPPMGFRDAGSPKPTMERDLR